jgi:hypothetical protein
MEKQVFAWKNRYLRGKTGICVEKQVFAWKNRYLRGKTGI